MDEQAKDEIARRLVQTLCTLEAAGHVTPRRFRLVTKNVPPETLSMQTSAVERGQPVRRRGGLERHGGYSILPVSGN